MKQPDTLNTVAKFHEMFQHPVLPTPTMPPAERAKLRMALLAEELRELGFAIADRNIVAVADALCDLQYVLSGAVLEFGLGEKFEELFNEVHRSNMSKACTTVQEAQATVDKYRRLGIPCFYTEVDGRWMVYRNIDNKTIKSISYSPADLESIVKK